MNGTIGFIGLGDLGRPIAANLLDAGHRLLVHNRTPAKADALVARGAERAARPIDAILPGGIVVTLLWDDASVETVMTDDALTCLGPNGVHISMSTISPEATRRLAARHAEHGSALVAAPIFGRPEAAAARQLWILTAGPQHARTRVHPILTAMGAQQIFDFGEDPAAAATVKLVGNFLLISAAAAMTEALTLAANNGLDPQSVVDMLTATLFPAPIYRNYGRAIAAGTAPTALSPIPQKDLGLFRAAAQAAAAPATIATLLLTKP